MDNDYEELYIPSLVQQNNFIDAEEKKKKELLTERDNYIKAEKTLLNIMLAIAEDYRAMFPGAGGSIIGRVKGYKSLETKIMNEFTAALKEFEGSKDPAQDKIIDRINKIGLKDIFATSVITEILPEGFDTGNDVLDGELTEKLMKVKQKEKEVQYKEDIMYANKVALTEKKKEEQDLKIALATASSQKEIDGKINRIHAKIKRQFKQGTLTEEAYDKMVEEQEKIKSQDSSEKIEKMKENIKKDIELTKANYLNGIGSLEKAKEAYKTKLAELQYLISANYAQMANKRYTLMFWGTKAIREPVEIQKPGFRATNTGYRVEFTNPNKKGSTKRIDFEIQGRGYLDYLIAEFGDGAEYHEKQKTEDGMRSKRSYMPDFTIIGAEQTEEIEKKVRKKYLNSENFEWLENEDERIENLNKLVEFEKILNSLAKNEFDNVENGEELYKYYCTKYSESRIDSDLVERIRKDRLKAEKENFIQKKINGMVLDRTIEIATSTSMNKKIDSSEELKKILSEIETEIKNKNEGKSQKKKSAKEIKLEARIKLLYKLKAKQILTETQDLIPLYFQATIPESLNEPPVVAVLTPGECIYKLYYNRIKGLKTSDDREIFPPKLYQERALFNLTDLFDEKYCQVYTRKSLTEEVKKKEEGR